MEQVDNVNTYAAEALATAISIVAKEKITGFAIVVLAEDGRKMANTIGINGYEMAGILQALSVNSCLGAQKNEASYRPPSTIITN
jgi:hypothetical protein